MDTIKNIIQASGRLKDVIYIADVFNSIDYDYPVEAYVDDNESLCTSVSAEDITNAIRIWKKYLEFSCDVSVSEEERAYLDKLYRVAEATLDMKMRNYVIACADRNPPEEDDLGEIRCYLIFSSSVDAMINEYVDPETNEYLPFEIPDGWKLQKIER